MKTWNIPVAVAQKFAANEYISACTATINCNLNMSDYAVYWIPYDEPVIVNGETYDELPYTACGETHDVALNGQLSQITISKAGKVVNGAKVNVDLETPIQCYYWELYDEEGHLTNMHCTTSADGFQSNKS